MASVESGWTEDSSEFFIEHGHLLVPHRWEQLSTLASLVPAQLHEEFVAADIACGAGVLSELLLQRFPGCRLIALDGSTGMLAATRSRLVGMESRVSLIPFDLHDSDWLAALPPIRCFVSSLAIHHLDGLEKRAFFRSLYSKLEPGGAVLIADLVEAPNAHVRALWAASYDAAVREQSLKFAHSMEPYRHFSEAEWNHFLTPDVEFDKPSDLFDQLTWLSVAGFEQVGCFWLRAGHAVYGGYKPQA